MEGRLDEDAVGWFLVVFLRRTLGASQGRIEVFCPLPSSSLAAHREQRALLLLVLLLVVLASGSGFGSGSSIAGMKVAGGEVELDKMSKLGHGLQEVMLLPAGPALPGKGLCKSCAASWLA